MKLLVINGPNLNMLGIREPSVYGSATYSELEELIRVAATEADVEVEILQSNHEGVLVDAIQQAYQRVDGIIINPAAYTHTSIAILDALKAVGLPAIEVHISNVREREEFRQVSYVGMACFHTVMGQGLEGYRTAIRMMREKLLSKKD